jgi:hypothetical protein
MSFESRKYSSLAPPLTSNSSTSGINFGSSTSSVNEDHHDANFNNQHGLLNLISPDVSQTSSTNISTSTSMSSSSSCDQLLLSMECPVRLSLQTLSQSSHSASTNPCHLMRGRQNGHTSLSLTNIDTHDHTGKTGNEKKT